MTTFFIEVELDFSPLRAPCIDQREVTLAEEVIVRSERHPHWRWRGGYSTKRRTHGSVDRRDESRPRLRVTRISEVQGRPCAGGEAQKPNARGIDLPFPRPCAD